LYQIEAETIKFEAAWVLTNIAAGNSEHTRCVVENDCVPELVRLIKSNHGDIREQAVWALGNIAGDSLRYRQTVLRHNTLDALQVMIWSELHQVYHNLSTLKICIWALSNLCRGNGSVELDYELLRIALPVIEAFLTKFTDDEVLMDACWALARTLRGLNEKTKDVVVGSSLCQRIVEMSL